MRLYRNTQLPGKNLSQASALPSNFFYRKKFWPTLAHFLTLVLMVGLLPLFTDSCLNYLGFQNSTLKSFLLLFSPFWKDSALLLGLWFQTCKQIQAIYFRIFQWANLDWIETPKLWPPDAKSLLIWKDPDAGKDWRREKGMTEDEMVGWHHRLNGHEFGWTPGAGAGQGGLACCGSWGRKELNMIEQLNWTELNLD